MQVEYGKRTRIPYVKQLETVYMAAAKQATMPYSSTTNATVVRAELGIHPLNEIIT